MLNKIDNMEKLGNTIKMIDGNIEGACDVKGQDFDYVCYWARAGASASTSEEYLHYMVIANSPKENETNQKEKSWLDKLLNPTEVSLSIKKGILPWGRVNSIYWKGDSVLAKKLNEDTGLTNSIIQILQRSKQPKKLWIYFKSNKSYAVIRTPIYTLTAEDFEIMNMIARHIKSAWFGR
jgi:hypothetical protein